MEGLDTTLALRLGAIVGAAVGFFGLGLALTLAALGRSKRLGPPSYRRRAALRSIAATSAALWIPLVVVPAACMLAARSGTVSALIMPARADRTGFAFIKATQEVLIEKRAIGRVGLAGRLSELETAEGALKVQGALTDDTVSRCIDGLKLHAWHPLGTRSIELARFVMRQHPDLFRALFAQVEERQPRVVGARVFQTYIPALVDRTALRLLAPGLVISLLLTILLVRTTARTLAQPESPAAGTGTARSDDQTRPDQPPDVEPTPSNDGDRGLAQRPLYDAFISYRRHDGRHAARWLRTSLRAYRLPKTLTAGQRPRLDVYLDTVYERALGDFYEDTIEPALRASAHLVLLISASSNQPQADGSANWQMRELADFLRLHGAGKVIVAKLKGAPADLRFLGAELADAQTQIVDLQSALAWPGRWFAPWRARGELLKVVATLFEIQQPQMPLLVQEDEQRRRRSVRLTWSISLAVLAALASLGSLALLNAKREQIARREARVATIINQAPHTASPLIGRLLLLDLEKEAPPPGALTVARELSERRAPDAVLIGHGRGLRDVVFDPAGKRVVTTASDGAILIWSLDGKLSWTYSQPNPILGGQLVAETVRMSSDGTMILSAHITGSAYIGPGSQEQRFKAIELEHGHSVRSAVFNSDSTLALTASDDMTAKLWTIRKEPTGVAAVPGPVLKHQGPVRAAELSPAGNRVVTCAQDGARLWSIEGTELAKLADGDFWEAHFSQDGRHVLVLSDDGRLLISDLTTSPPSTRELALEGTKFSTSAFGGTAWIGAGTNDGRVVEWALDKLGDTPREVGRHDEPVRVSHLEYSKDARRLLSSSTDGTALLSTRGETDFEMLRFHLGALSMARLSPDGSRIVTASGDALAAIWSVDPPRSSTLLTKSCSGTRFAVAEQRDRVAIGCTDGTLRVTAANGQPLWSAREPHASTISEVQFTRDRSRLISASIDGHVISWDLNAKASKHFEASLPGPVLGLAVGDGSLVALVTDQAAWTWHPETGQTVKLLDFGKTERNPKIALSPNGEEVVVAHHAQVSIWHAGKASAQLAFKAPIDKLEYSVPGRALVILPSARGMGPGAEAMVVVDGKSYELADDEEHEARTVSFAFGPNGNSLALGRTNGDVLIWDQRAKPSLARRLKGHTQPVLSVSFDARGQKLASVALDGTVRIWSVDEDVPAVVITGLERHFVTAQMSPDGTQVIAGRRDGTALVYSASDYGPPQALAGGSGLANVARFIDDDHAFVATTDGTARIWPVTWRSWLNRLRTSSTCLWPTERVRYLGEEQLEARTRYAACEKSHGREAREPPRIQALRPPPGWGSSWVAQQE